MTKVRWTPLAHPRPWNPTRATTVCLFPGCCPGIVKPVGQLQEEEPRIRGRRWGAPPPVARVFTALRANSQPPSSPYLAHSDCCPR